MDETLTGPPLTLQAILDDAAKRVRRHFGAIYFAVALPLAVVGGLVPVAQSVFFGSFASLQSRTPDPLTVLPGFGLLFVSIVFFAGMNWLGFGCLQVAAVDVLLGRGVSMRRAWLTIVSPRVMFTGFLSGLIIGLGFLFCVLPGIYASLLYCLVIPVIVAEGTTGTLALRRSYALMTSSRQKDLGDDPRVKAFLIFLAGVLLGYVLNLVVQAPTIVVQQVLMMRNIAAGRRTDPAALMARLVWLQVPTTMLTVLLQSAVRLYVSFCVALLFVDLRRRKEGGDLEEAITSLGPGLEPRG